MLQQMVAEDPSRADTWRLIGRIHQQQNQIAQADQAFRHALSLQPDNIAAHFDLGELMTRVGNRQAADYHFDQVMQLGPDSTYATQLVQRGVRQPMVASPSPSDQPPPSVFDEPGLVQSVGYEIQTFDGADDLERRLDDISVSPEDVEKRFRAFVEFGALYNSNISLTPISRELAAAEASSAQAFFNPDIEWIAIRHGDWRSGALFRGYFSANEGNHASLDLSSFQPGAFIERDLGWGESQHIGRFDYVYSVDLLDQSQFADRHSVTASLTSILPDADVIYTYFTTSFSDFADDGATPAVDSLDGVAYTFGVSRFFQTNSTYMPSWSLGLDGEWADTEGADFRYKAINMHGDATFQWTNRLSFIPGGGIGYRDYGDFTGPVSRDELTWRLNSKLRWQWTDSVSISAVVRHDRFASDNENFDTERTEGGIIMTWIR